jgi:transposase
VKREKVPLLPSKAPFSKRFEDAVGMAFESAAARRVARQFRMAESTVRAIDLRYLERWAAARRKPALHELGVDEIHLGKKAKFLTVASNLESGEPLWFGRERKKETLDEFFHTELSARQRGHITAACVDMWEPFRLSIEQWAPHCKIVYDKFHIMQHANAAVDEVRRAEFFRKSKELREVIKGKRWLLLSRWINLNTDKRRLLNELFALNRRLFKAYLLKESLDRLWAFRSEAAMLRYLQNWIDQLRWQRLKPLEKFADMLFNHLDGLDPTRTTGRMDVQGCSHAQSQICGAGCPPRRPLRHGDPAAAGQVRRAGNVPRGEAAGETGIHMVLETGAGEARRVARWRVGGHGGVVRPRRFHRDAVHT